MARDLDFVLKEISRVATEAGLDPRLMTRTEFLSYDVNPTEVTKHDITELGGWTGLRVDAAKKAKIPHQKNLPVARGVAIRASIANEEDKVKATADYFSSQLLINFEKLLSTVKIQHPLTVPPKSDRSGLILNLLWSDLHFGMDVYEDEVLGSNYNWNIASRRMAKLVLEATNIFFAQKVGSRHDKLRIFLNGDVLTGVIHLTESTIRPMTEQMIGALQILSSAISYLATVFPEVEVVCTPGNHDRMTYRDKGRALTQRWDSYATVLYISLEAFFKSSKNVSFNIPISGLAFVDDSNGGYIVCSHGDVAPNTGNVTKSINVDKLAQQAIMFKSSGVIDKPISAFLFGHWHVPTLQMLSTGQWFIVNGSLIGTDAYTQNGVNVWNATPAQIMFETEKGSPVKNITIVKLRSADNDETLDKIIPKPKIFDNGKMKGVR